MKTLTTQPIPGSPRYMDTADRHPAEQSALLCPSRLCGANRCHKTMTSG